MAGATPGPQPYYFERERRNRRKSEEPMKIGVCVVKLRFPGNGSLKGKRRILKSLLARASNKFNISIAEVEDQELWQVSTVGFSCVGNEAFFVNQVLTTVVSFLERSREDAELLDYEIEIMDAL